MGKIQSLVMQFLFFAVYLTATSIITHLFVDSNNIVTHAVLFFSSFSLIYIFNDRVFKLYGTKKQAIFIVMPLLFFAIFLWLGDRNDHVKKRAKEFCDSVQIDESVQALYGKCKAAQVDCSPWDPVDGISHHQAWFNGYSLYAYACEIRSEKGKVISKFFEEHTD